MSGEESQQAPEPGPTIPNPEGVIIEELPPMSPLIEITPINPPSEMEIPQSDDVIKYTDDMPYDPRSDVEIPQPEWVIKHEYDVTYSSLTDVEIPQSVGTTKKKDKAP